MRATTPTRAHSWKSQVYITVGVLFGGILLAALLAVDWSRRPAASVPTARSVRRPRST